MPIMQVEETKLEIITGIKIGRISVGDLVRFVQDHPLYEETPTSYLQQGRLRECVCDCGVVRLIAESILASGRIKSCGCLRQEIRAAAVGKKIKRLEAKAERMSLTQQIHIEQARLRMLKMQPIQTRDPKALEECATRVRSLFSKRGILTRKIKDNKLNENTCPPTDTPD